MKLEYFRKALKEREEEIFEMRKKYPDYCDFPTPKEGQVNIYVNSLIDIKYDDGTWSRDNYGYTDGKDLFIWSRRLDIKIEEHQERLK